MIIMKKAVKRILLALALPVTWLLVFALCLANWGNIMAKGMETKYRVLGYPQDGVVLMGSSSMQVWTSSEADLGPFHSVNVGIGGSVVKTWIPLVDKLVTPFHPKAVVIYIGANDIHNNHTAADKIMEELAALFNRIHRELPDAKLYYVSVYTTGAHTNLRSEDEKLNGMVKTWAEQSGYLSYTDCSAALLDTDGNVRKDIFLEDQVHLNNTGYAVWSKVIRDALLKDFPVEE